MYTFSIKKGHILIGRENIIIQEKSRSLSNNFYSLLGVKIWMG